MNLPYFEEETFQNNDYTTADLPKGEYECCTFKNCNFAESDLAEVRFMDCEFISCNLSNSKMNNASMQDVSFKDCKILGVQFEDCNQFAFNVRFENCQVNFSSFHKMKLAKSRFINCQLSILNKR